jgi:hypothetical protein
MIEFKVCFTKDTNKKEIEAIAKTAETNPIILADMCQEHGVYILIGSNKDNVDVACILNLMRELSRFLAQKVVTEIARRELN